MTDVVELRAPVAGEAAGEIAWADQQRDDGVHVPGGEPGVVQVVNGGGAVLPGVGLLGADAGMLALAGYGVLACGQFQSGSAKPRG